VPPGTIFVTTLPIWPRGEGLLHAARAAKALRHDDESKITIRFRSRYSGLSGRILPSLSATAVGLILEAQAAKGDEAIVETTLPAHEIEGDLTSAVYPLVSYLFERFGVSQRSRDFGQRNSALPAGPVLACECFAEPTHERLSESDTGADRFSPAMNPRWPAKGAMPTFRLGLPGAE
jgi:hypothetical protein